METTNKVVEVIDALCEKFGIAIDWTSENIVPYAQSLIDKIVNYKLYTSIFWLCIIPLLTLGCFFIMKYCYKKASEDVLDLDSGATWAFIFATAIFVVGVIASLVLIFTQTLNIITCITFPEKVVIDYIKSIMSSGGCVN